MPVDQEVMLLVNAKNLMLDKNMAIKDTNMVIKEENLIEMANELLKQMLGLKDSNKEMGKFKQMEISLLLI